jgi:hypothetical protein
LAAEVGRQLNASASGVGGDTFIQLIGALPGKKRGISERLRQCKILQLGALDLDDHQAILWIERKQIQSPPPSTVNCRQ